MSMSAQRSQVTVRVDPEVRALIERAAEEDRRTVSGLVRIVLADWVKSRTPPIAEGARR
jgi:hypothetical protein